MGLHGCIRACDPCKGESCPRYGSISATSGSMDTVQETVDAVSGATWTTRNRIMENLFHQDLESHADDMPSYKPPGS